MKYQKGSSLIFTMIVLVAMLFGSVALFKSTDMASTVAGNLAFKEASVNTGDIALNAALTKIQALVNKEANSANYFATQRQVSSDGIPCDLPVGGGVCSPANTSWGTALQVGTNKVYYIIDRICKATPSADPSRECLMTKVTEKDHEGIETTTSYMFYRVSVKVVGANNTESYIQLNMPIVS